MAGVTIGNSIEGLPKPDKWRALGMSASSDKKIRPHIIYPKHISAPPQLVLQIAHERKQRRLRDNKQGWPSANSKRCKKSAKQEPYPANYASHPRSPVVNRSFYVSDLPIDVRVGVRQNYSRIVAGNILAEFKEKMVCGGGLLEEEKSRALFG
jgi:hypothetical protein